MSWNSSSCHWSPTEKLDTQMSQILNPHHCIFHGPNTVDHFDELSVDGFITELHTHAPDLYKLLNVLDKLNDMTRKMNLLNSANFGEMTSAVALLKCRSVQVLDVQLLLTLMLVARSTSRQVTIHNIILLSITCYTVHVINLGNCSPKSHGGMCIIHYCWEVLESSHS